MGVARIFQRGGGHTGSNNIVMAFSPRNIVGYLLKKKAYKGGGSHGHPRNPPRYAHGYNFLVKNTLNEATSRFVYFEKSNLNILFVIGNLC